MFRQRKNLPEPPPAPETPPPTAEERLIKRCQQAEIVLIKELFADEVRYSIKTQSGEVIHTSDWIYNRDRYIIARWTNEELCKWMKKHYIGVSKEVLTDYV